MCSQVSKFYLAARRVLENLEKGSVKFETLDLNVLRQKHWNLSDLIDWLLGGHIHFIIAHLHQGLEGFGWPINSIYDELKRLKCHEGFPNLRQLECPILFNSR